MAQRIIILLTEGDHDAAFLYRILKANGFSKFSSAIKDFPNPLNNLLASDVLNISIPEESLQSARTRFLPSNVMTYGDNMLLVYALQGESRRDKRIKLIDAFNMLNDPDPNAIQAMTNSTVAVLYFLDADDKGVQTRLAEINHEMTMIFADTPFEALSENSSVTTIMDVVIGAHIFTEDDMDTGKLEDVLLPMMEAGNEEIFKEAYHFLSIHEDTSLYKGNVEYNEDASVKKVFGEKYHYKKSLIGTIGQLQKSGKSNTVCISDAKYLNDKKISANPSCCKIIDFIRKSMI